MINILIQFVGRVDSRGLLENKTAKTKWIYGSCFFRGRSETNYEKYSRTGVAGMFYPASPSKLKEDVQQLLLDGYKPEQKFENVFGIVSPHAGYLYSGRTAAFAFNSVGKKK